MEKHRMNYGAVQYRQFVILKFLGALLNLIDQPNHKFSTRPKKGMFVGYSENSKTYRIYLHNEKRVIISRSIRFFEIVDSNNSNLGQFGNEVSTRKFLLFSESHDDDSLSQPIGEREIIIPPRFNQRTKTSRRYVIYLKRKKILLLRSRDIVKDCVYECNGEISIKSALKSTESDNWYKTMISE